MKDLLNIGQVLDRSEMKKIMAGSSDPGGAGGGGGSCYQECTYIYNQCLPGNPYLPYTFQWHYYNNYCMDLHNCCARDCGGPHPCDD